MAITSKPLSIANVVNGKSPFTHYAWAWNSLGTDRFTQLYPNENMFTNATRFVNMIGNSQVQRDQVQAPNGFRFTGQSGNTNSFRIPKVITSNGEWTVSFKVRGNQNTAGSFSLDICDQGYKRVTIPADNSWLDVEFTVNVTQYSDTAYNFVDFSGISWLYFFVSDFKVEKSATKTMWTPSPKDDPTNAYPLYQGVYTDNTATGSTNPQKYTWQRIKGNDGANGQDGKPGENAPYVTAVQVQYAQSLDGVTPPTSGWVNDKPAPNMGYWQWQRVRDVFSNGTYGTWVATSVYYGRDAIIVSATEPNPKVDNMLWQKPSDPNVLMWNGSAWVQWGISIDNIVADNVIAENGRFQRIDGVEIYASIFGGDFTYIGGNIRPDIPANQVKREGTMTLTGGELENNYGITNNSDGVSIGYGKTVLSPTALAFSENIGTGVNQGWYVNYTIDGIIGYDYRNTDVKFGLGINDMIRKRDYAIGAASGFAPYGGGQDPIAERHGRLVELSGGFRATSVISKASLPVTINQVLPIWARPRKVRRIVQQGSGMSKFLLVIYPSGVMQLERYGTTSTVDIPSGGWINISTEYSGQDILETGFPL